MAVLLTHGHFDHMLAADDLRDEYGIPIIACAAGSKSYRFRKKSCRKAEQVHMSCWQISGSAMEKNWNFWIFPSEVSHTRDIQRRCCYYLEEEVLFSGDTLFAQSVGRTDFPTGSGTDMQAEIKAAGKELPGRPKSVRT